SDNDNGNGSLMRILPIVYYLLANYGTEITENDEAMAIIHNVSSLTHAHKRSLIACGIYCSIAAMIIGSTEPTAVSLGISKAVEFYRRHEEYKDELSHYERLNNKSFASVPIEEIKSSGYVVDTLEAAVWCLLNTNNYKECVLMAVNLGEDTDTVAAVAGGLAGLYYGYGSIPQEWLSVIVRRDYVEGICSRLNEALSQRNL
ncbi:MAG TPA: ADP-ribosylglycohydrolase family protein, partial [Bacillota bacterium]|nr:ADP-ribosylglycohydrolase family protein [Bacillota bacterium]